MKRIFLICFISLLIANVSFSQSMSYPKQVDSLIVITPQQLKVTNLIFLEHQKLLITDSLQKRQIRDLKRLNGYYSQIDSIQQDRIDSCLLEVDRYNNELNQLSKKQKRTTTWSQIKSWAIGILGVSTLVLLFVR